MAILSATEVEIETPMPDTIKAGSIQIEEGTSARESLRFEGEPWTRFYLAGEIIRDLQKMSGKQSKCASADDTASSVKTINSYHQPRNVGSQVKHDPGRGIGQVGARVDAMELDSERQVNEEAECSTSGYGSASATSFLPTELVRGKTSRRRWPSRTRISSTSSTFPRAVPPYATIGESLRPRKPSFLMDRKPGTLLDETTAHSRLRGDFQWPG